jgi:hypothetical protein
MQGIPLRNVRKEGEIASLAASAEVVVGQVNMQEMRDYVVTTEATYHASATVGVTLNLYYSPDGEVWDTVPYAYYVVNLTAGSAVRESAIIDVPAVGYLKIAVSNGDATYAATLIKVHSSFSRYGSEFIEADRMAYKRATRVQKGDI